MQSQSKRRILTLMLLETPLPTNNTNQYKVQQIVVNFCPERNKDGLLPQPQQTKQEEERKTKHQWWRWQGHNSKGSYSNTAGICPKKYSVLQKESACFEPNTVPSTFYAWSTFFNSKDTVWEALLFSCLTDEELGLREIKSLPGPHSSGQNSYSGNAETRGHTYYEPLIDTASYPGV